MDISCLIERRLVLAEAKSLAESKGKAKSFEPTKRFLSKRNNEFRKYLTDRDNLDAFCAGLTNYKLDPYRGFALRSIGANGKPKYRPLLIPSHKDRLLFSLVNKLIFPLFEEHMKRYDCLGIGLKESGRKISTKPVIDNLIELNRLGYSHVLKTDFRRFFCTIPRKRLLQKVKKVVSKHPQGEVLYKVIAASLHNDITSDGIFNKEFSSWQLNFRGVPQGLSYSSLLASFYGTILDNALDGIPDIKHKRYLDDMVVLGRDENAIGIAFAKLKEVSVKIGLELHDIKPVSEGKTFVVDSKIDSYIFLGTEVRDGIACVPEKAISRFKNVVVQEIVNRSTVAKFTPQEIKQVFDNYTLGWKRAYSGVVSRQHFGDVKEELNLYLNDYLNKNAWKSLRQYDFRL